MSEGCCKYCVPKKESKLEFFEKSRSNYFRVTNIGYFKTLCEKNGLEILYDETGSRPGEVGFIISDGKNWKGSSIHKFKKQLSKLLQAGEVFIVRTITYERESMKELHAHARLPLILSVGN